MNSPNTVIDPRSHPRPAGPHRRHRPRLRRPAARRRVRARRLRRHRLRRRRRRRSTQINAGKSYIPDVAEADLAACVKAGKLRATTDMSQLGDDGRDRHLRADAAAQDQGSRSVVRRARRSKRWRPRCKRGQLIILESTTYPGTTDEVVQPMLEAQGLEGRRRFLPRVFARARRSGQPAVQDQEHPEDRRRRRPGEHRGGRRAVRRDRASTSSRSARRASPRW